MWPVRDRTRGGQTAALTPPLAYALAGLEALYQQAKPRHIMEIGLRRRRVDLFTDGFGNVDGVWGSEFLGAVCRDDAKVWYTYMSVAEADGGFLKKSEHRINKVRLWVPYLAS